MHWCGANIFIASLCKAVNSEYLISVQTNIRLYLNYLKSLKWLSKCIWWQNKPYKYMNKLGWAGPHSSSTLGFSFFPPLFFSIFLPFFLFFSFFPSFLPSHTISFRVISRVKIGCRLVLLVLLYDGDYNATSWPIWKDDSFPQLKAEIFRWGRVWQL